MGATYVVEMFGKQFTINEVAFTVFGFDVYWYGILIALGLVIAIWWERCFTPFGARPILASKPIR